MRVTRLSASKMKTYTSCGFKFFLNYQLAAPQKAHFAAELGSLLHLVLERFAQAFINGVDEQGKDIAWLNKNWKKIVLKDGFQTLKSWQYNTHVLKESKNCNSCKAFTNGICGLVKQNVDDFNGCPWNAWVEACNMISRVIDDEVKNGGFFSDPSKILATEQEFRFEVESGDNKYLVNGIIDLVIEVDEDTVEIIDYKTGRHKLSYNAAEKDIQLRLYYLAARRLYPDKKHHIVTILYLHEGKKQITPVFNENTEKQIMDKIVRIWDSIESDEDPVRIADRSDGTVQPNHICKYLCNWDLCQKVKPKFDEFKSNGGLAKDLNSLEDLGLDEEGNAIND